MTTAYSSFFASGLLAPPQNSYDFRNILPTIPSSPTPGMMVDVLDDTSDVEIDRMDRERSTTPTPSSSGPNAAGNGQPRLRKRRSSLTMGTSVLNGIKSPMRNAGNAFQFQRHLHSTPSRSRSGSLSSVITYEEEILPAPAPVTADPNKRKNRLRSGSIGTALKARSIPRAMPPPEAPLPPLPPLPSTPTHMKSFSIPPRFSMPVIPAMPMSSSSRQVLGELQP
ncbi:hypothetical protein D9758_010683 [Tetrapyrgos nigripes]|uniref:Uncharacterized protein n=1 Tax=Tetrapyrgos nigripes TaxID=182062 RepID=A0A8H5LNR9_9AGAR|nr:hypothetical protein D9758_010683 [Tetrapyrgos nigripes]